MDENEGEKPKDVGPKKWENQPRRPLERKLQNLCSRGREHSFKLSKRSVPHWGISSRRKMEEFISGDGMRGKLEDLCNMMYMYSFLHVNHSSVK